METLTWASRGSINPVQWLAYIDGRAFSVGRVVYHEGAYWYEPARDMNQSYAFHLRAIKLEGIDTMEEARDFVQLICTAREKP